MKPKQPIETFMPPNILKARAGNYGGGLDAAALRRAETALVTLKSEFAGWLAQDVQRLGECGQAFMRTPLPQQRDALYRASHDLKGQAQTYEFPLVARVAASLCALLDGDFRSEAGNLLDAHIGAIRVIVRDNIKDANDPTASLLAKELENRVREHLAARNDGR